MSHSNLYWIEDFAPRLAIMARPRAGDWLEDEVANWKREGVGVVVSLLESDEVDELGLAAEPALCREAGIEFVSFPIADRGVPRNPEDALSLARRLVATGKPVAIHCRAGIGRSSIMAALVLSLSGIEVSAAFEALSAARRLSVPDTEQQRLWVETQATAT